MSIIGQCYCPLISVYFLALSRQTLSPRRTRASDFVSHLCQFPEVIVPLWLRNSILVQNIVHYPECHSGRLIWRHFAAISSLVQHFQYRRYHSIKICMRQLRFLRHFGLTISTVSKISCNFLHDQLDKVDKVRLPVGQVGQLCHANFCMALLALLTLSAPPKKKVPKCQVCHVIFSPSISFGFNPDSYSIIYYVYNTEPARDHQNVSD